MRGLSLVRTGLERLVRGRAIKRTLAVANRDLGILASGDAQLKYLKLGRNSFDQDLIRIAECCLESNDTVWDVGANIGVFSIAAAAQGRRAIAFEADIWLAGLLRRSALLSQNAGLDICVVPCAVTDKVGILNFQIASRGRASNALADVGGRSQMGGVREEVPVPTFDFDTLVAEFGVPDFIKIDVEGAELMVIKGGDKLFSENSPVIYAEIGEALIDEIVSRLAQFGYLLFDDKGCRVPAGEQATRDVFFAKEAQAHRIARLKQRLEEEPKT